MTQIRADWYDDPAGSGQQRYWDGLAWTTHLRAPQPAQPSALNYPPPAQSTPPARVNPYANSSQANGGSHPLLQAEMYNGFSSPGRRVPGRPVGVAVLIFGIVFAGIAIGISIPTMFITGAFSEFSSAGPGAVEVQGHVTSLDSDGAGCMPVASFEVNGVTHTAASPVIYSPCNTSVGRAVTVSYLPNDIDGTSIVVFKDSISGAVTGALNAGVAIAVIIGLLVAALGLWMIIKNPTVTQHSG